MVVISVSSENGTMLNGSLSLELVEQLSMDRITGNIGMVGHNVVFCSLTVYACSFKVTLLF